jgi:thioredoxin
MEPIVDGYAERYQGKVALRKINANEDPEVSKLGVSVVPTYIFLDASGNVIERQEGGNPQALLQGFKKAAGQ